MKKLKEIEQLSLIILENLSSFITLLFPYSYCQRRVLGSRGLLVVVCFYLLPNSPSGPPWNEGHRPKVCHETSVFEIPVQEQHEHSFYSSSLNTFITGSLYTVRECRTSRCSRPLGEVGLTPRQYTGMECSGACSLYWRSLSVGAAA